MVKRLADNSPSEGLKSLEEFCRSLKQAIQWGVRNSSKGIPAAGRSR
jgi:HPt (histidine-containing phosphotransfer) domain-containing protein